MSLTGSSQPTSAAPPEPDRLAALLLDALGAEQLAALAASLARVKSGGYGRVSILVERGQACWIEETLRSDIRPGR